MMIFAIQINPTTLPALIFGGLLVGVAVGLCVFVWRGRRAIDPILADDERARLHADRQLRRRIQVAVMLGLIGILISLGDQLDKLFIQRPFLFFVWVITVFVLVIWMVMMALGDWLSTMIYSSAELSHLRHERRELEEEIRRYHATKNGHQLDDEGPEEFFTRKTP